VGGCTAAAFTTRSSSQVRRRKLPEHLHWFYWESYSTWLTGFCAVHRVLLVECGHLPDRQVGDGLGTCVGGGGGPGFLVVFWLAYDAICRVFGQREEGDAVVGALVAVLVCVAAWLACHWFAGRAAFLLVGAMIATTMSANVFFWIIPGQRAMVASIQAGQPVDPIHGKRGKQRSVHNTYFTLPVLFAMLSNHYSFTYSHPHNWLVLIAMMFAGAAIRQFFVLRHGHKLGRNRHPWPYAAAGVACVLAVVVWLAPQPQGAIRRRYRRACGCRGEWRHRGGCRYRRQRACPGRQRPGDLRPTATGVGPALLPVPRRPGANEKCAGGLAPGAGHPRPGGVPAGGGEPRHANEQLHRHHPAERELVRRWFEGGAHTD